MRSLLFLRVTRPEEIVGRKPSDAQGAATPPPPPPRVPPPPPLPPSASEAKSKSAPHSHASPPHIPPPKAPAKKAEQVPLVAPPVAPPVAVAPPPVDVAAPPVDVPSPPLPSNVAAMQVSTVALAERFPLLRMVGKAIHGAPPYLVSAITHLLVLIVLSVWVLPLVSTNRVELVVLRSEEVGGPEPEELAPLEVEQMPPAGEPPPLSIAPPDEPPQTFELAVPLPELRAGAPQARGAGGAGDEAVEVGGGSAESYTVEQFGKLEFEDQVEYLNERGLDLVIVFDSTGSMGSEINNVKLMMTQMGAGLLEKLSATRISLVTYRDDGDVYTHLGVELTKDVRKLNFFLRNIVAGGGGDWEEGVQYGMYSAVKQNKFRKNAHKVMLVFGDAPPHDHNIADCVAIAREFYEEQGGQVSTITCGAGQPIQAFRQISDAGMGTALTLAERNRVFQELLVLVFGTHHRKDVEEFFELK